MNISSAWTRGLVGAAAALAIGGAAYAQPINTGDDANIGVGMICDSQAQADRFVELRTQGQDPRHALAIVNKEAKNPRACGMAAIAFRREATLGMKTLKNELVQIVRINILAGFNGAAWQPVSDNTVQYAVMQGEGESI